MRELRKPYIPPSKEKKLARAKTDSKRLLIAAEFGDIELAQQLLDKGVPINPEAKEDELISTPLCDAVVNRQLEMVKFLISRKADVNQISTARVGTTPLLLAIGLLETEIIDCLLINNADPNLKGGWMNTPLEDVIGNCRWFEDFAAKTIRKLKAAGAKADLTEEAVHHLVSMSCLPGDVCPKTLRYIKGLLKEPVLRLSDLVGLEASEPKPKVHTSEFKNNLSTVVIVNNLSSCSEIKGITYFSKKSVDKKQQYASKLARAKTNFEKLLAATIFDDIGLARELIYQGTPVNADPKEKWVVTPLYNAVSVANGCMEMVKLLVAAGADVNQKSTLSFDEVPLMRAISNCEFDLCIYLLEHGANVNYEITEFPESINTPLMQAIRAANRDIAFAEEVIVSLIKAGAIVDLRKKYHHGKTLLEFALEMVDPLKKDINSLKFIRIKKALETPPMLLLEQPKHPKPEDEKELEDGFVVVDAPEEVDSSSARCLIM